jgi:hypothetical protein
MRHVFLLHYGGCSIRCVALPFEWSRSTFWFARLLAPFISKLRRWGCRVLGVIDNVLVKPSAGRASVPLDCSVASETIDRVVEQLGFGPHQTKGVYSVERWNAGVGPSRHDLGLCEDAFYGDTEGAG